jgi:hypothetical protein
MNLVEAVAESYRTHVKMEDEAFFPYDRMRTHVV